MDNRILDKIKKCLRLAQSDNPNEAAAGLRQAQKLMEKHGYNEADVALSDVNSSDAKGGSARNPANWLTSLMHMVSEAFGVKPLYVVRRGPHTNWKAQGTVEFIGLGDAPEVASYAFTILYRQLKRDRTAFLKASNPKMKRGLKTRRADIFAEAWIYAVRKKVHNLVVTDKQKSLIERYVQKRTEDQPISEFKDRSHKNINRADAGAIQKGYEAGRKVQLYQGVGGKAAQESLSHLPQHGGL